MSEAIQLSAALRTEAASNLKDIIPAVVYGSGIENASLSLKRPEFEKVFAQSGESGLITLKLDDGRELPVIVKDLQFEALKNRIIHVDFYKVNMDKKVTAETSLNFIGEAPAVKAHGGIVVEHLDQLEVECLPSDLVQKIDIDISVLAELGDAIHVRDIKLPKGVEAKTDLDQIVVHVVEPKKVVEEAPVAAPAEGEAAPAPAAEGEAKGEEKKEE
jgi:large subunit ribosomal protein L25